MRLTAHANQQSSPRTNLLASCKLPTGRERSRQLPEGSEPVSQRSSSTSAPRAPTVPDDLSLSSRVDRNLLASDYGAMISTTPQLSAAGLAIINRKYLEPLGESVTLRWHALRRTSRADTSHPRARAQQKPAVVLRSHDTSAPASPPSSQPRGERTCARKWEHRSPLLVQHLECSPYAPRTASLHPQRSVSASWACLTATAPVRNWDGFVCADLLCEDV